MLKIIIFTPQSQPKTQVCYFADLIVCFVNQLFGYDCVKCDGKARATALNKFFKFHSVTKILSVSKMQATSQPRKPLFGVVSEGELKNSLQTQSGKFQFLNEV